MSCASAMEFQNEGVGRKIVAFAMYDCGDAI